MIVDIDDAVDLCRPLVQTDLDHLVGRGVPPLALARSWDGIFSPVLRAHVVETAPGRFEFTEWMRGARGRVALIIEALDRFGELDDLVAWNRTFLGTWLGRAAVLGEEQLHGFRLVEHVTVHETPLDWLADGRQGVVVVDWNRAGPILREHPLRAADLAHGRRLAKACTVPPPRISVPVARRAA